MNMIHDFMRDSAAVICWLAIHHCPQSGFPSRLLIVDVDYRNPSTRRRHQHPH